MLPVSTPWRSRSRIVGLMAKLPARFVWSFLSRPSKSKAIHSRGMRDARRSAVRAIVVVVVDDVVAAAGPVTFSVEPTYAAASGSRFDAALASGAIVAAPLPRTTAATAVVLGAMRWYR